MCVTGDTNVGDNFVWKLVLVAHIKFVILLQSFCYKFGIHCYLLALSFSLIESRTSACKFIFNINSVNRLNNMKYKYLGVTSERVRNLYPHRIVKCRSA